LDVEVKTVSKKVKKHTDADIEVDLGGQVRTSGQMEIGKKVKKKIEIETEDSKSSESSGNTKRKGGFALNPKFKGTKASIGIEPNLEIEGKVKSKKKGSSKIKIGEVDVEIEKKKSKKKKNFQKRGKSKKEKIFQN